MKPQKIAFKNLIRPIYNSAHSNIKIISNSKKEKVREHKKHRKTKD